MPFPFIDITAKDLPATAWEPPREFEWNIDTRQFVIRNGSISVVEGLLALRIWMAKCLLTVRGRFDAYTWDFGTDLESLVAGSHTRESLMSEAKRMVSEALLVNKHITGIEAFELTLYDNSLNISFTALTDCGSVSMTF